MTSPIGGPEPCALKGHGWHRQFLSIDHRIRRVFVFATRHAHYGLENGPRMPEPSVSHGFRPLARFRNAQPSRRVSGPLRNRCALPRLAQSGYMQIVLRNIARSAGHFVHVVAVAGVYGEFRTDAVTIRLCTGQLKSYSVISVADAVHE